MKIEDRDQTILLVVSLPPSYKHFKEIMLYSNFDTISFEDIKSNMLSKEKFDLDIHANSVEGLVIRGKTTEKENGNRSKNRSKPKKVKILTLVRLAINVVNWVILLLTVGNCKTRGRKKKIILMSLLELRLLNLIRMVTFCLLPLLKGEVILI